MGSGASRTYTDQKIAALIDTAPNALNTLNELAAALNDDANYATTVVNALAAKANESSFTAHTGASTSVHGIADTSLLETTTGAQSKADAAQSAAVAAASIQTVANPAAAYALGTVSLGRVVYVQSVKQLWTILGGANASVEANWVILVTATTSGVSTASLFATADTVDDAVGGLISPLLLAGM
jgi:hypothetical protein